MALESYNCVLCQMNVEESLLHLFLQCLFALSCWNMIGLAHLVQGDICGTVTMFRNHLQNPFSFEIIVAMFWAIWSARNDVIFRNLQHRLQTCKVVLKSELARVKLRVTKDSQPQLQLWIDSFV